MLASLARIASSCAFTAEALHRSFAATHLGSILQSRTLDPSVLMTAGEWMVEPMVARLLTSSHTCYDCVGLNPMTCLQHSGSPCGCGKAGASKPLPPPPPRRARVPLHSCSSPFYSCYGEHSPLRSCMLGVNRGSLR